MTCMSAIVCLNVTARTPIRPSQEIGQFLLQKFQMLFSMNKQLYFYVLFKFSEDK